MTYLFGVAPPYAETDRLEYVIHDLGNVCPKCRAGHIEQDRFVTASDIESDAAWTDRIFVRDYSADWDGIAFVMVGHQRNLVGCLCARLDLTECAFVGWTPNWNVVD